MTVWMMVRMTVWMMVRTVTMQLRLVVGEVEDHFQLNPNKHLLRPKESSLPQFVPQHRLVLHVAVSDLA